MPALQPKEKKLLMVLGVILLIMAYVYGSKYLAKSGGRATAQRNAPVRSSSTAAGAVGGVAAGAGAARSGGGRALTPGDIPVLNEETKRKLKAAHGKKVDLIDEDRLRYETKNPFLPLELTDKAVERIKLEEQAKNTGGAVMQEMLYFRGALYVGGQKYAVIERADRKVPWYVREGEPLLDTDWVLQNIDSSDQVINLLNTKAKRDRDRIRTIPYSGIEDPTALGLPGADGTTGAALPGGVAAGGVELPGAPPQAGAAKKPGPDDFEIVE